MKETPLSTVEKNFIIECIEKNLRLDGRNFNEFRPLKINFGADVGSAHVTLGETRCLAHVTCELGEPKATRPNEGLLYINVDLGPMAAIHFEGNRMSDLNVQINRILERTFKDSGCIDLESLCVTAEEKVWILRVDVNVLNHEGNIIDCASVAVLCALIHFRHPDVTVSNNEIKVHTSSEKDPIPIVLHHYPLCISFATFQNGEKAIADPSNIEERTADANMIFGFNSYREICCINLGGSTLTSTKLLLECAHKAANRAKFIVDQVKELLAQDTEARSKQKPTGLAQCLRSGHITTLPKNRLSIKLSNFDIDTTKIKEESNIMEVCKSDEMNTSENLIKSIDKNTSVMNSIQDNIKWVPEEEESSGSDYTEFEDAEIDDQTIETEITSYIDNSMSIGKSEQKSKVNVKNKQKNLRKSESSSDSEEETKMILG